ncbi:MAG TPA: putative metal-binding motif-containing protein, partial [Gemmatimonadaceae bacterium]|nr:putative metal-binding motif-containing protein [Gemmatimonadaceae bacterium]
VVTVASDAMWRSMTAAQFADYDLILMGDKDCAGATYADMQALYDTRNTWVPQITGRVMVSSLDPACHLPAGAITFMRTSFSWLTAGGGTALYITGDWGRRSLDFLSPLGTFSSVTMHGDDVRIIAPAHASLAGSTDASLSSWGSSYHSNITGFPTGFSRILQTSGGATLGVVRNATGSTMGLGMTCTAGVGACLRTGTYVCDAARTGIVCTATAGTPTAEICDNIDNDCDGSIDEGVTRSCYSGPAGTDGVGVCRAGTQVCTAGTWSACGGDLFQITAFGAAGCTAVEHGGTTGDDRGAIAVSSGSAFYTGDSTTGRFPLDLSSQTGIGRQYDAMVSNVRTEQVYTLANGATPIPNGGGTVTTLIAIDGTSGALLTGTTITLSTPITLGYGSGLFSGFDRIVLHDASTNRVYSIALPSGAVTLVGTVPMPAHTSCESWAFWGVAEYFGGVLYETYVANSTTIERMALPAGTRTTVGTFTNLSDMCAFTVSPSTNRWYWHHEGTSQFRSGDESIGFCTASMTVGGGTAEVLPSTEVCDGLDNDCDAMTDESLTRACYTGPAGTSGVGICRPGTQTCTGGAWPAACSGEVTPATEL